MGRKVAAILSGNKSVDSIKEAYLEYEQSRSFPSSWSPLTGLLSSKNPWDYSAQNLTAAIQAATPEFARGIFGEVGVLSDSDVARYRALLGGTTTPRQRADYLFGMLRGKLRNQALGYAALYPDTPVVMNFTKTLGITKADVAKYQAEEAASFSNALGGPAPGTPQAGNIVPIKGIQYKIVGPPGNQWKVPIPQVPNITSRQ
jgi:hypothetical protein